MRGQKGGFWDRLFFRIRKLRLKIKLKKEKEVKKKETKQKQEIKVKKQKQEEFIYIRKINKSKSIELPKIIIKKEEIQKLKKVNSSLRPIRKKKIKCVDNTINSVLSKTETKSHVKQTENNKSNSKKQIHNNKVFVPIKQKQVLKQKKVVGIETNIQPSKSTSTKNEKLIKEIRKIIEENKSKISTLTDEIIEIENNINNSVSNDELNKIYEKLLNIKKEIEKILKNYEILKYSNNLKGLNVEKINELVSEINNNEEIKKIVDSCSIYLDYYNELSNLRVNEQSLEYKTEYKKQEVSSKKTILSNEKIKFENISKIERRLSYELYKQQNILNNFNKLINNIEPEKIVKVQSNYVNNLLHKIGGIFTAFLSLPFLKNLKIYLHLLLDFLCLIIQLKVCVV